MAGGVQRGPQDRRAGQGTARRRPASDGQHGPRRVHRAGGDRDRGPWTSGCSAPAGLPVPAWPTLEQVGFLTAAADGPAPPSSSVMARGSLRTACRCRGRRSTRSAFIRAAGPRILTTRTSPSTTPGRLVSLARRYLPGLDPEPVRVESLHLRQQPGRGLHRRPDRQHRHRQRHLRTWLQVRAPARALAGGPGGRRSAGHSPGPAGAAPVSVSPGRGPGPAAATRRGPPPGRVSRRPGGCRAARAGVAPPGGVARPASLVSRPGQPGQPTRPAVQPTRRFSRPAVQPAQPFSRPGRSAGPGVQPTRAFSRPAARRR